jgi:hypothetical protein
MIEDSIHDGKYPLEDQQKHFANSLQVINRSDSDDLKSSEIIIEVRINGLYITSNYVPNIEHLPGIIEVDVLDSFKILCRRLGRMKDNAVHTKGETVSTEDLHTYTNLHRQDRE